MPDEQPPTTLTATIRAMTEQLGLELTEWQENTLQQTAQFRRVWLNQQVTAEPPAAQEREQLPEPMRRALELRRNRNTGPAPRRRAPRRINPSGGIW